MDKQRAIIGSENGSERSQPGVNLLHVRGSSRQVINGHCIDFIS